MDSSTVAVVASIIVAIVAIIPGVAALINQAKNDANKAKLDMNTATLAMLDPLQKEVTRLNARVVELEQALIAKTKEIGDLTQEIITKDNDSLKMKFEMEKMQMKLDSVLTTRRRSKLQEVEQSVSDADLQERLLANEARAEEEAKKTKLAINEIESKSITNGKTNLGD